MGKRLEGKVAIITGAGRGIGQAEALALAAEGARIVVNDINRAEETVEQVRAAGGEAVAAVHSAATWPGAEAIVATAVESFGRVDILINNAGITRAMPITELTEEAWDAVVDLSLKGYAAMIRFAAPHMIAHGGGGVIINTGSSSGFGHRWMTNYSAAKEGALGLTRTVARELGEYGVRCNLIRPINFDSETATPDVLRTAEIAQQSGYPLLGNRHMTIKIFGHAEVVAAFATFLCLPQAAHVSGQDFFIGGDQVGRYPEPEMIRNEFCAEGWTLQALEQREVVQNLLGGIPNTTGLRTA
jgi:NAD(P)-dependent dehydrogenase (short-subunit alcohol dehydrogenase family)